MLSLAQDAYCLIDIYITAVRANVLKFDSKGGKRGNLQDRLLATGERELVFASPFDGISGVGLTLDDAKRKSAGERGENQFGKALMEVRGNIEWLNEPLNTAPFNTPGSKLYINW